MVLPPIAALLPYRVPVVSAHGGQADMVHNIVLIIAVLLLCLPLRAQQYHFRHLTVEHGLPSLRLYQVLQDREGYLWFATDNGVARYDGHSFTTFTTADGFTDYGAFHMMQDSYGRLWFMTFSGRACYYRDGVFTPFAPRVGRSPLEITWVVEDSSRVLWFGTRKGDILLLLPDGTVRTKRLCNNKLVHSMPLAGGVVFFSGDFYFVSSDLRSSPLPYTNQMPVFARFFRLADGTTLLTNDRGINRIDRSGEQLILPFGPKMNGEIFSVFDDGNGCIWVGGKNGLYYFSSGRLSYDAMQHLLPGRSVTSVIRDTEGNYWCTTDDGAYMLSSRAVATYREEDGLSSRHIVAMQPIGHRSLLLMARDGSLYRVRSGAPERLPWVVDGAPHNPTTTRMFVLGEGRLLLITARHRYVIDGNGLPMTLYRGSGNGLYRTPDGTVWVYEPGGVYHLANGWLRKVYDRVDSANAFSREVIAVDARGRCWIGNRHGLIMQDARGVDYYGRHHPLLYTAVADVQIGSDSSVWVATKGQGVFRIRDDRYTHLTTADGLAGDNCGPLLIDESGRVWVIGSDGLTVVEQRGDDCRVVCTYSAGDILPSNDISAVMCYGDTVYVAGSEGLTVFRIRDIRPNTTPPPVYITRVAVAGQQVRFAEGVTAGYHSGVVTVDFTGIVFRRPGVRSYRYRLLPADTAWTYTHSGSVQFPLLEPGSYVLEVAAQNYDGVWSTAPATLALHIQAPYWQSWWFRSAGIAAGLVLVLGAVHIAVRRHTKKNAMQRMLLEMELRALRSQMNPHFIFNALNSIQDFILRRQSRDANLYLTKFARLIRLILDYSSRQVVTLREELDFLQLYVDLEQLRFEQVFTYRVCMPSGLTVNSISIPPMILQPIVENAIKHGLSSRREPGVLTVSFDLRDRVLYCAVEDNGVGRAEAQRLQQDAGRTYASIGLRNTRERLALAHGVGRQSEVLRIIDLYDTTGAPCGTRVEWSLPLP